MRRYTRNPEADRKIEEDLKDIVNILKRSTDGIYSILLVGALGKGEGLADSDNNLYSDYDVFVITKHSLSSKIKANTIARIREVIGKYYKDYKKELKIDVRYFELSRLKKVLPILRFFDMKYASTVIYGKDAKRMIPGFVASQLPLYEGFRLLLNRLCFIAEWFSIEKISKWDDQKAIYAEISKNYMVCCYALCMMHRQYRPQLKEALPVAMRILNESSLSSSKYLGKSLERYCEGRLNSRFEEVKNPQKEWFYSINALLDVLKEFLGEFVGGRELPELYPRVSRYYLKDYVDYWFRRTFRFRAPKIVGFLSTIVMRVYRTVCWFFKLPKTYPRALKLMNDPVMAIYAAAAFGFAGIREGKVDMNYLTTAAKLLGQCYPFVLEGGYPSERFDNFLRALSDAHTLRLNLKELETIRHNNIEVLFRNFN